MDRQRHVGSLPICHLVKVDGRLFTTDQQPATRSGVNDINQPSELSFVVPVCLPWLLSDCYLHRKRFRTPSTTACNILSILWEVVSLISLASLEQASHLISVESSRVTSTGS